MINLFYIKMSNKKKKKIKVFFFNYLKDDEIYEI